MFPLDTVANVHKTLADSLAKEKPNNKATANKLRTK